VSRRDHAPRLAVDFSPPRRRSRAVPVSAIVLALMAAGVLIVAVTQLLLR